jgi:ADP-heptose:LPS heptosyltransferase
MRRIGILNLTRFGDLIQTSPVLVGLRKRYPQAEIELIVKSRFRAAAELLPGIDAIREIDGNALANVLADPRYSFLDGYRAARRIADHLGSIRYDTVFNFTHSRMSAAVLSLLDVERVIGFCMDRHGHRQVENPWLLHMGTVVRARKLMRFNLVDVYLGAAGLHGCGESLCVRIDAEDRSNASSRLPGEGRLLAVQLSASSDAKAWSVERYADTLRALDRRMKDLRVVLVGVAAERGRAQQLMALCPHLSIVDLVGETSVSELAAVLERCHLLLTGDTGTMHLSAAVGTRTCTVFVGLGNPWETAAYGEGHVSLLSRLSCAPCQHHVRCGNPVCHRDVPPEWLALVLDRLLHGSDLADVPPLERADLFQSQFDGSGMLDLLPLHVRKAESHELFALAYRALFLESLEGHPFHAEAVWRTAAARHGVPAEEWICVVPRELVAELTHLARLASEAQRITASLVRVSSSGPGLVRAGERLRALDEQILRITSTHPLLAPIGFSLSGALESLPEEGLITLATLCSEQYGLAGRRAAALHELILGPASKGGMK